MQSHTQNLQPLQPQPALTTPSAPTPGQTTPPKTPSSPSPSPSSSPPPPPSPPHTPDTFTTPHKLLRRNHFWNIHQTETSVTTTHGKGTGPNGRSTTRNFTTVDQATNWCKTVWNDKISQGYVLEKDFVKVFTPTQTHDKSIQRPSRKRVPPSPFAPPASPPRRTRGRARMRARGSRGGGSSGGGGGGGGGRSRGRGRPLLRGGVRKRGKLPGKAPIPLVKDTAYDVTLVRLLPALDETCHIAVTISDGAVVFTNTTAETGREPVVQTLEFLTLDDAVTEFRNTYSTLTGCQWGSGDGAGWRIVNKGNVKSAKWLYQDGTQWLEFGDEAIVLETLHAEYQANAWLRQRLVWTCFGNVVLNLENMTISFRHITRPIRRVEHVVDGDVKTLEHVPDQVEQQPRHDNITVDVSV